MTSDKRRPKWVWAIFIWFMFGGLTSIYNFYMLLSDMMALPAGVEQPFGAFYFFQAFGVSFLAMIAAAMLFFRIAANRWLFLAILIISTLSTFYSVLSGAIPDGYLLSTSIIILATLGLYGLIARYTFKLVNANYYNG
ncbi:hypothetical protein OFY17_13035 [Marinomonas sp. C2222]|uniref:Uncharacterized protein n=1 Tax=Marinomonas sargassi TaxID=2984494 RepID=A0ABT2YV79_9GAMM|nr:hypothetical protein [Marinomonas sargassi]MCV2403791.1 hypothetical protein [Marinomonas sargassi]